MAKKFLIECPVCGRINEASTSFFAKRKIECQCGHIMEVKAEKMRTKQCPHCGNLIVYNRGKTDDPICPVCKEHLIQPKDEYKFVEIICPECSCHITAEKSDAIVECPLCNAHINLKERLKEQEYLEKEQPTLLKCEKNGDVCVWKHQSEDFAFGSQIIVNESQVALFIRDGKLAGKFEAGRHMVTFNNLILSKDNFDEEAVSFHSQLFFVSKTFQINQRWGTDSKIRMFDPLSGLHVELGACGTYNYRICDYEKFLFYVIGLGTSLVNGIKAEEISLKFRPNVVNAAKCFLGKIIKENDINILEVDLHTQEISDGLLVEINKQISKFGIELTDFIVSSILTPDYDPNFKRMKEQYAEKYLKVQDERIKQAEAQAAHDRIMTEVGTETDVELAKARAAAEVERIRAAGSADAYRAQAGAEADEMRMKGYTYQDETRRMVTTEAVEHMGDGAGSGNGSFGVSGLAEDAVKVGMIKQMGKEITGDLVDAMNIEINPLKETPSDSWKCPNCGKEGISSKFCPECGEKKPEKIVWKCPKCGREGITSKFCPDCGASMPSTWVCPDCGTKNIESKFCPNCGRKKV